MSQRESSLDIVHVTSYQVPGYGYEELPLALAQARLGHRVTILTSCYLHPSGTYAVLGRRFQERKIRPTTEQHDGVSVVRLPSFEVPGRRVWIRGLESELVRRRPSIVHCHNLLQLHSVRVAFLRARRALAAGLVIDDHMHESVVRRSPPGRAFYWTHRHLVQPWLARHVDSFCAIWDDTRRYLADRCGVRGDIEIRPLGVDARLFSPSAARRAEWRARLGLAGDDLVFLYTGKVVAFKGVEALVSAALRVGVSHPHVHVVAVGDPDEEYVASLRALVAAAGRQDHLHFLPSQSQEQLAGLFCAADVAVWPRQESRSIVEALSCSLPVIVSAQSGYAGLVSGGLGQCFGPGDEDLDRAMLELTSPESRADCGGRGRALVERELSWDRCAEKYLSTYRAVLGRDVAGSAAAGPTRDESLPP